MRSEVVSKNADFGNSEAVRFFRTLGGNGSGRFEGNVVYKARKVASLKDRVKMDLLQNGLKLSDLAQSLGVRLSVLSDYLSGRRNKVGRKDARKIKEWLVENGYLRRKQRMKLGERLMMQWSLGSQLENIVRSGC